jgi:hypothetical protein
MAERLNMIGVLTRRLPFDLANQLYNEFDSRLKEAHYFIENFSYYKSLQRDLRVVEMILALSIFHKRVITNLDAVIKFQGTVQRNSSASEIMIGSYTLDRIQKNKLLGILIEYRKLRERFGLNDYVFEFHETKDFLRQVIKFRRSFGKRSYE